MTTIRQWLNEGGFDWDKGRIIIQEVNGNYPGEDWNDRISASEDKAHFLVDKEFDSGYGGPECPRFIAEDKDKLYFPEQYDGATSLCIVFKDISKYLNYKDYPSPYPGG